MKRILAIAVMCLFFTGVRAQETPTSPAPVQNEKLSRLMSDREQLVLEYQYYNQQNSNFWGKKSKKDLIAIIETLKKIINKDTELIAAVKETSIKKIAENTVKETRVDRQAMQALQDQRQINDRISNLQGQVAGLENQVKMRERKVKEMEAQVESANEARYGKDKIITILAAATIIFLIYTIILQMRLNKANAAKRKKVKKV